VRYISIIIVASKLDPASLNIKNQLLKQAEWTEINNFQGNIVYRHSIMNDVIIVTINDRKIKHENLDKEVDEKLGIETQQVIFISKHDSKTGKPTLTTHPVGNYGEAQLGGKSRTLVESSPILMTNLLRILKRKAKEAELYHKVCFEVTHHGPYLSVPTLFVEVGSNKEEWENIEPARVVAKSVLELLESGNYEEVTTKDLPVLIGIGGGHYAPRFTDVVFEKRVAFGHMIPFYQIESGNIDNEMFEKALKATPNVNGVYINKKTLKKSQVSVYKQWFEDIGIPVLSSKDFPKL
jgi:D-aminoacyl-tRNA deacylase